VTDLTNWTIRTPRPWWTEPAPTSPDRTPSRTPRQRLAIGAAIWLTLTHTYLLPAATPANPLSPIPQTATLPVTPATGPRRPTQPNPRPHRPTCRTPRTRRRASA
jgi:hypothetical protein